MKNQKRLIKYFIIISILIIGTLPMINLSQYTLKDDFKKLFNTDKIEKYVNYTFYKMFNKSLEQDSVIIGKDGFLFLGNKYGEILHIAQGIYPYNKKDIDNWTNQLKNVQNWYKKRGIKFVVVIAPNKHSIYKDKLPNWVDVSKLTMTDDIFNYSRNKNINILDIRDTIIKQKVPQLYFSTDTHWNNKGASIAYTETIKYTNKIYDTNYKIPNYSLSISKRAGGDLAGFLKINSLLPDNYETDYPFVFQAESNVCHGIINKEHKLEKCINKRNLYMGINEKDQYMTNSSSMNSDKLLLLCDSFGTANSKLYNETFKTIWKFHYSHISGNELSDFVLKNKPDIVIYQVIERDLYNSSIVKKLSDNKILKSSIHTIEHNNNGNKIFDISNSKYKNNRFTIRKKELITTNGDPIIILNKLKSKSKLVRINYNLDSSIKTIFQVFYKVDKNAEYSENNSYRIDIKKGNNKISLSMPAEYINNTLRVDLVSSIGKYKINDFSIYEEE